MIDAYWLFDCSFKALNPVVIYGDKEESTH